MFTAGWLLQKKGGASVSIQCNGGNACYMYKHHVTEEFKKTCASTTSTSGTNTPLSAIINGRTTPSMLLFRASINWLKFLLIGMLPRNPIE